MIRMNEALRERLKQEVAARVSLPALVAAEQSAYDAAAPLVRATVEEKYPPRDMRVCQKYDTAGVDDCINLQLPPGDVRTFQFRKDTGPLVVKKTYQGSIYLATPETAEAVLAWEAAREDRDTQTRALHNDYLALIRNARSLEEIAEVWPEAAEIEPYARSQVLTTLSPETIERIRADVARRTRK